MVAGTNTPLRVALVTLTGEGRFETRYTITGDAGNYEFAEVPPGRYWLTARSYSFITLSYGQLRPFQSGRPIVAAAGQVIDGLDWSLPRGGSISGTVVDDVGMPEPLARVTALRVRYEAGRQTLVPEGEFSITDDRGDFHLLGLQPGAYYVSVAKRVAANAASALRVPVTYAPGTQNLAFAQRVDVQLGEIARGVDVSLAPTSMATVSGIVVDEADQPIAGARVILAASGTLDPFPRVTDTGVNQGSAQFSFTGVSPGAYDIRAIVPNAGIAAKDAVVVGAQDLTDLRLRPIRTGTAKGRVTIDGNATASLRPAAVAIGTVSGNPQDPAFWNAGVATLNENLTFSLPVLPGRWLIDAKLPAGWYLKSVLLRGVDVTDSGIDVAPSALVEDVDVVVTNRPSSVSGTVRDSKGDAVDDYTAVVFAKDPRRRTLASRYFAQARPDANGGFVIQHLPAGEYFAIALEYLSTDEMQNPAVLEQLARSASTLIVRDGENRQLQLELTR